MIRVTTVPVHDLSSDHERLWRELRTVHRAYASPFYALEYVRVASRSRPCEVAVIEDGGRVVGLWPFERHSAWVTAHVGHPGSDHHGPLVPMDWEPSALALRGASWPRGFRWIGALWRQLAMGDPLISGIGSHLHRFTALPAEQRAWQRYFRFTEGSPIVVLDRYEHAATNSNSNLGRKLRRLAREVGEWRYENDCTDPDVLEQVLAWKRAHCRRTGFPDFGEDPVRMRLLRDLFATRTPELRGRLSVLWAGGEPIAGHFGLLSERVWHWWLPSYDTEHERHSPGLLMLHAMLRAAANEGIEWLDFGTGKESFKRQFANDEIRVATGTAHSVWGGIPVRAKQALKAIQSSVARPQLTAN